VKKVLYVSCFLLVFLPFKAAAQFVLKGNAVVAQSQCPDSTATYQITANVGNEVGAVWYPTTISLNQSFDIQFELYLGSKIYSVGADGMCFVMQQQGISALGMGGGDLGFTGISPSIGIEFDTYRNGYDPVYCHTAIEKNGNVDHTNLANTLAGPVQLSPSNPNMPDGNWHHIEITWSPVSDSLSLYYDCVFRLAYQANIISGVFNNNPNVYWGITAGTGGSENLQEICLSRVYYNNLRDTTVCEHNPVYLKVSGGVSYRWSPAKGLNNDSSAAVIATPDTTTKYIVTITNSCGRISKDSVTITIYPAAKIAMSSPQNVLCHGNSNGIALATASGAVAPYTYSWSSPGGTKATLTGLSVGRYTVTVTDANGCVDTASIAITQPLVLVATATPINTKCNGGGGGAVANPSGGTGPYTYLWTPGGQTNDTAKGLAAGTYTVKVTDAHGCSTTASVTLSQPTPLTATIATYTAVSCNGGNNGSATVSATGGTPAYTYSWAPSGGSNAVANNLTVGTYTVIVTDANGCTASTSVIINQPAVLGANMGAPINVLCNGGNNGNATVTVTGGTPIYTYAWSNGQTNANAVGLTAGSYTVNITDANGCTASASVTLTQPPLLVISMNPPVNILCNGEDNGSASVSVTGGTPGYAYAWSPSGETTDTATVLIAGVYTVAVTDNNHCTATASITLTQPQVLNMTTSFTQASCNLSNGSVTATPTGGTTPYSYLWNSVPPSTNQTVNGLSVGTYSVLVKDNNGCTTTGSVTVTQPSALTATITGLNGVNCNGGSNGTATVLASGGTMPYTYSWSPVGGTGSTGTGLVAGTYTVYVYDADGCQAIATIKLIAGIPLGLTVEGKTAVCPGGTVNIAAIGTGGDGVYKYLWLPSNLTTSIISFNPTRDSVITVQLNDDCGSTPAAATVNITINPLPGVSFRSDVTNGCVPLCVQFKNSSNISSGGIGQSRWSFGNGDSSKVENPIECYSDTGIFSTSLTVISDSGCSSALRLSNMITVYPVPKAAFTYAPQPIDILNPVAQFTDLSTSRYPIVQWYWTFADNDTASFQQNPIHHYADTGTFCATLTVVDIHGCTDSATNCMVVEPLFSFYIPDAFTPNGDGINDVFMPKGTYVKQYEMYIFDRWGNKIFYSTDINIGWDGTKGGSACIQDTYVYLIKVTDAQGNPHSYTGRVNLVK